MKILLYPFEGVIAAFQGHSQLLPPSHDAAFEKESFQAYHRNERPPHLRLACDSKTLPNMQESTSQREWTTHHQ